MNLALEKRGERKRMFIEKQCLFFPFMSVYSWLNEKNRKTLGFSVTMLSVERDA